MITPLSRRDHNGGRRFQKGTSRSAELAERGQAGGAGKSYPLHEAGRTPLEPSVTVGA